MIILKRFKTYILKHAEHSTLNNHIFGCAYEKRRARTYVEGVYKVFYKSERIIDVVIDIQMKRILRIYVSKINYNYKNYLPRPILSIYKCIRKDNIIYVTISKYINRNNLATLPNIKIYKHTCHTENNYRLEVPHDWLSIQATNKKLNS